MNDILQKKKCNWHISSHKCVKYNESLGNENETDMSLPTHIHNSYSTHTFTYTSMLKVYL